MWNNKIIDNLRVTLVFVLVFVLKYKIPILSKFYEKKKFCMLTIFVLNLQ